MTILKVKGSEDDCQARCLLSQALQRQRLQARSTGPHGTMSVESARRKVISLVIVHRRAARHMIPVQSAPRR